MRAMLRKPSRWQSAVCRVTALLPLVLTACSLPTPPAPATPRVTSQAILEITPAATQDIEATATAYARELVPTPTPAGLYVVQPGDTLSALAQDFGSTVDEIMAANGLTDPNALQVGQSLIIPSLVQSSPALDPSPAATHTVTSTVEIEATPTLTTTAGLAGTQTAVITPAVTAARTVPAMRTVTTIPTLSTP